jgi:glutamine amidotransferase
VLPGVGAFSHAMRLLNQSGLDAALRHAIAANKPTLGICLGMQMLMAQSEEDGVYDGLAFFPARVTRFPASSGKVPHMGWNSIEPRADVPLFYGLTGAPYVYFVHSYRVADVSCEWTAATARYGGEFTAAVWRGNLFGTQFHPEKSGEAGLAMLRNFAALTRGDQPTYEKERAVC